jgi:uncharacterized protein
MTREREGDGWGWLLLYVALAIGISTAAVWPLIAHACGWSAWAPPRVWHGLGALGPFLAAILVTLLRDGPAGVGSLLGRYRPSAGGGRALGFAALSPLMIGMVAVLPLVSRSAPPDLAGFAGSAREPGFWLDLLAACVLYGFGEELGWRGFMLERLLRRHRPLLATALVFPAWALWHVPFFFYRYHFSGPGAYAGFYIGMACGAVVLTYIYLMSRQSVLAVALWHTMFNLVTLLGGAMVPSVAALASFMVMLWGLALIAWPRAWDRLVRPNVVAARR